MGTVPSLDGGLSLLLLLTNGSGLDETLQLVGNLEGVLRFGRPGLRTDGELRAFIDQLFDELVRHLLDIGIVQRAREQTQSPDHSVANRLTGIVILVGVRTPRGTHEELPIPRLTQAEIVHGEGGDLLLLRADHELGGEVEEDAVVVDDLLVGQVAAGEDERDGDVLVAVELGHDSTCRLTEKEVRAGEWVS